MVFHLVGANILLGATRIGCLPLLQNARVRKELTSKFDENDTVN